MDTLRTLSEIDCLNYISVVDTACGLIQISNFDIIHKLPDALYGIDSWKIAVDALKKFLPWFEFSVDKYSDNYETCKSCKGEYGTYGSFVSEQQRIIIDKYKSFMMLITKMEDDNKTFTFWISEYNEFIQNPLTHNFRANDIPEYHKITLINWKYGGNILSFGYGLNGFQHLALLEKWCEFMEAFKVNMDKMRDDRIKSIIHHAQYKFMKNEGRRSVQDRLINDILIQRGMHQRLMKCLIYLFEAEMKCKLYKDYKKDYNLITLKHLCEMYKCYLKGSDVDIRKILETLYKTVPFTRKKQFKETTSCCGFS